MFVLYEVMKTVLLGIMLCIMLIIAVLMCESLDIGM